MEKEIELEQEAIVVYSGGGAVNSVNGYTGDVVLTTSDLENTSDYQTGTEVESAISTAIAGKQDTLTAGNNITISNNTISATDTTYSAGTGLTLDGTQFSVDTNTIATQQDVSNEATARENADTNLQGQIDAISASSDVTDIVGTYADLQAYDTTHLKDNDIIKVLQDESQDDETTYYRWSTSTQTFTLIGEEGPYYTKSQTDTLLQAKQDTLTAGSNITIASDNTISATDTTYSAFTGTDGQTAGTAGLVPAPATTDAGKFLKADGTWDTAGGGSANCKELTAADYNYDSNNDGVNDTVALWLLDPGVYWWDYNFADGGGITFTTSSSGTLTNAKLLPYSQQVIIGYYGNDNSGFYKIQAFSRSGLVQDIYFNWAPFIPYIVNTSNGTVVNFQINAIPVGRGDGSGPTVVQTTGTSTTDVMSQNATTNAINAISQSGAGAPTTSTTGTVGQLYQDTTNGDLYICTDATNPYVWEEVGSGGGGGDTVYSSKTTSNSATGGAVYIGNLGTDQTEVADPTTTDNHYKYFWALPASNNGASYGLPGNGSVNIMGSAKGAESVAIGNQAGMSSYGAGYSVMIGSNANAGPNGVSIGYSSGTSQDYVGNVCIGANSKITSAGVTNSVALGRYSTANRSGEVNVGTGNNNYGFNSTNYRVLGGVHDPVDNHDAATKGYVDPTTDSSAPTTATVGRLGQIQIDTTTATAYMCVAVDTVTPSYTWRKITS